MRSSTLRVSMIQSGIGAGLWTAYGFLSACQLHYGNSPMPWNESLRSELGYAWLWAAWTPLILREARRFQTESGQLLRSLSVHIPLMIVVAMANRIALDLITGRDGDLRFDSAVAVYALLLAVERVHSLHRRNRTAVLKAGLLEARLNEIQSQALRMQLHPHFLFNTLHTITELIHEDPDSAEQTIARLGELLRMFIATSDVHEVPLSEELRILDLYLDIERARFEDQLQVRFEVPESLYSAVVPSLVLQPLAENSIRHSVGRGANPGCIVIAAELEQDRLVLRVTDNGEGLKREPARQKGSGLAITRGRLATLYGPHHSLVLRNVRPCGVEARISVPFHLHAHTYFEKDNVELQSTDR